MNELNCCPFCQGEFLIKEVACRQCHTEVRGTFKPNRFQAFNVDDLHFIELFLKNEGNIKLMEKDLKISYPTVKNRLKSIIKTLGYTAEPSSAVTARTKVLNELAEGSIDVTQALDALRELP